MEIPSEGVAFSSRPYADLAMKLKDSPSPATLQEVIDTFRTIDNPPPAPGAMSFMPKSPPTPDKTYEDGYPAEVGIVLGDVFTALMYMDPEKVQIPSIKELKAMAEKYMAVRGGRRRGSKFDRCVKTVRKTVKARKGSNKESAAIAICVTSVLHPKGRTLKRYRKGRLVTQKRK
jgi:hypothetical protein